MNFAGWWTVAVATMLLGTALLRSAEYDSYGELDPPAVMSFWAGVLLTVGVASFLYGLVLL